MALKRARITSGPGWLLGWLSACSAAPAAPVDPLDLASAAVDLGPDADRAAVDLHKDAAPGWRTLRDTPQALFSVWGSGARDVWTAGPRGIYRWDGAAWSLSSPTGATRLWGSGPDDIWAVGSGRYALDIPGGIQHFDGRAWTPRGPSSYELNDVWGSGPSDVWAVGESLANAQGAPAAAGVILHYDGSAWTPVTTPKLCCRMTSVWGSSAQDVWFGGGTAWTGGSRLLHWDGSAISGSTAMDISRLDVLWGAAASDVWILGRSNSYMRWDGAAWSVGAVLPPGGSPRLTGLFGRAPDDVWAVGGNVLTPDTGGLVVRWDGGAWRQVTAGVPAGPTWNDVWGPAQVEAGQPDLWIVGDGVVLARYP